MSSKKAQRMVKKLLMKAQSLDEQPRRGRVIPEIGEDTLRELIVGDYRLMYEIVDDETVEILVFWHGRRRFPLERLLDD